MINTVNHLINYQINGGYNSHSKYYQKCFDYAWNLYSKDLRSHYGCINAIEFSNRESEHIASGGDDRRVLIWSINSDVLSSHETPNPIHLKTQHHSNIFTLAWDNENKRIFSGGNDDQVLVHDVNTQQIIDIFLHADAVFCISVNPESSEIFATACENGQVSLYDLRLSSTDPIILSETVHGSAYQACCFNPTNSSLIATANIESGLQLIDLRMQNRVLLKYEAPRSSSRPSDVSKDVVMSVKFNQIGNQLLALRSRCAPVLYNLNEPKPIIQFDNEDYLNSCTLKSCCFVGDRDQYVCSGSDDFCVYIWRISNKNELHFKLKGHRSIVNQVRYHPKQHMLISSGVEKMIKVWTPFKLYNSSGGLLGHREEYQPGRRLYTNRELFDLRWFPPSASVAGDVLSLYPSMDEDQGMIAFFDSLVRREINNWSSEDIMDDELVDRNEDASESSSSDSDTSVIDSQDEKEEAKQQQELISFVSDNEQRDDSSSSSSCSSINSTDNKTTKVRVSLRDRIRNLRHRRSLNLTENSEFINVLDSLNVSHGASKRRRSSSNSSDDARITSSSPPATTQQQSANSEQQTRVATNNEECKKTIKTLNQQRRMIELNEDNDDDTNRPTTSTQSMSNSNTQFKKKKSRRVSESSSNNYRNNKKS